MVSGKQSRFIEGFKTVTLDDDILFQNLKNAINMSIESTGTQSPVATKSMEVMAKGMAKPSPVPTSGMSSEPMPTSTFGITKVSQKGEMSGKEMGSGVSGNMESGMDGMGGMESGMGGMESDLETGMGGKMGSKTSMPEEEGVSLSSFADVKRGGKGMVSGKVIGEMEEEKLVNRFEEDEEDDESLQKMKKLKENRKKNKNDDEEIDNEEDEGAEVEEGFAGSRIIEAKSMKNLLLAILISFIGYVIVMASNKNLLPIAEISPDLKKFKNLIYLAIFFIIVYLCLEIF